MKTFNIFTAIVCSLFLLVTTSCDQENIAEDYKLTGDGVSFLAATSNITAAPTQTSVDYRIARGNTQGKLELPITATYNTAIFTLPSSIVFEDGASFATLTIPLEKTVLGTTYSIEFAFDSLKVSPFGNYKTKLNVMRDFIWESIGTGYWTDGIVSYIFGADVLTYPVEVQEAAGNEGMYRMVNPYGLGVYAYTEEGEPVRDPSYIVIDARNPAQVVINETGIGIDWGYGEIFIATLSRYGTKTGTTITFPGTIAAGMRDYNSGNFAWWVDECVLELGEPEVVYDYSVEVEYLGRFTSPDEEVFAMAEVTLGADVEYAKVALAPGAMTQDILDGIIDGSIESKQITAGGSVSLPLPASGKWTFVVVSYADDEAQDFAYVSFNYVGAGGQTVAIGDFYGNYNMTGPSAFGSRYPDADMLVTIAAGSASNTFAITGIDLAENVDATFDPAKGLMSVVPQELADFYDDYYEETVTNVALLTLMPDDDVSVTAAMTFTNFEGTLELTPSSPAIGYVIIGDDEAGDTWYYDGYYDITFSPLSGAKAAFKKSPLSSVKKVKADEFRKALSNVKKVKKSEEIVITDTGKGSIKKSFDKPRSLVPTLTF